MVKDPPFASDRIAIVGVGLIGGSLGLAFKRQGIGREIVGISRQETTQKAQSLGVIDTGFAYEELSEAVAEADLVILCTPISRILELIPLVLSSVPDDCVVSDVGSTKSEIVSLAVSNHREGVHFIGGHPMAGSEWSGVAAADPFLFQNAIYVMTPAPGVPESVCDDFSRMTEVLGARSMRMDPGDHDRVAAAVSHLPQMMATALVGMVGKLSESEGISLQMAAGGFRDMTRIASSPFEMWRDICRTNAGPIREMIDRYEDALRAIRQQLTENDLSNDFEYANQIRAEIPKDSKGFLNPLHEILVVVEDRPGVIARVAGALADVDINIKDIEVLKVREGEGGTIRLGFGDAVSASSAEELLSKIGYLVRLR